MRPWLAAVESEIIRIGFRNHCGFAILDNAIGHLVALGIGDGVIAAVENQAQLARRRFVRAGPAHQRIDAARCLRLNLQAPLSRLGAP